MRTSKFVNFSISKFFEKFRKNPNNVISLKLQGFEQSYSEARVATPESKLTVSNYRIEIFETSSLNFFKSKFFEN